MLGKDNILFTVLQYPTRSNQIHKARTCIISTGSLHSSMTSML
uniref:Uncharacterized protein n=1 Tax=Rhizophora mucronata TaxID=61149 RepID=A0A2P2Q7B8_RHIMU